MGAAGLRGIVTVRLGRMQGAELGRRGMEVLGTFESCTPAGQARRVDLIGTLLLEPKARQEEILHGAAHPLHPLDRGPIRRVDVGVALENFNEG